MSSHTSKMLNCGASAIILLLLFLFVCAGIREHYIIAEKHSHWVLVRGTVEEADYKDVDKRVGNGPLRRTTKVRKAWCHYSYIVDGDVYHGKEEIEVSTLSHPRWGNIYGVAVYYNPLNPAESVIIRESESIPWFIVLLGLVFFVMMIWYTRLFFKELNLYLEENRVCFKSERSCCNEWKDFFPRNFSRAPIPKIIYAALLCLILLLVCLLFARLLNHGPYTTHSQELAISILSLVGVLSLAGFLILLCVYYLRKRDKQEYK